MDRRWSFYRRCRSRYFGAPVYLLRLRLPYSGPSINVSLCPLSAHVIAASRVAKPPPLLG